MSVILTARRMWKSLPIPRGVRGLVSPLAYRFYLLMERASRLGFRPPVSIAKGPLVVSGFMNDVLGLGKAARLTATALDAAGLHCVRHDIRPLLHSLEQQPYAKADFPDVAPGGVWIVHVNAPEAEAILRKIPHHLWRDRYRIGVWLWELEKLPPDWLRVARNFHEIWAPSTFVAEALRPHARVVRVMPFSMADMARSAPDRARFGFEEGVFVFAAFADGRSTMARKNPLGAVEAFKRAFPEPTAKARLVIKLVHPKEDPKGLAALEAAVKGRPDISFFLESLSDTEMQSFLASIDGLISLHRAEGFGLVIAEVMSLGKPAIATDWSATVDFMTGPVAETKVRRTLVPVEDPSGRYQGQRWAEPDLDHAAQLVRRVVDDLAFRERMQEAGPIEAARLDEPWTRERLLAMPLGQFLDL